MRHASFIGGHISLVQFQIIISRINLANTPFNVPTFSLEPRCAPTSPASSTTASTGTCCALTW
ncbi:hypothetical protein BVI434_3060004 [Burkholderia vietnamiensis]|nr:hypothetical protein BVI434_3060004 [Burkholderia vietnamiensis]